MIIDKVELKKEVEELRRQGHEFENGTLTRLQLKGFSGGLGCYAQKEIGKYMIRLKTPSGVITKQLLDLIIGYCEKYKLGKLHLTTRQAIQLHDLTIDEVCDIMSDGIDHDLFTRGAGGNFPRNVALSPMAGVDCNEAFDATPYALQAGQYFQERVTKYHLPRKLKVAFSSSLKEDTACATVNDMGFIPVLVEGKPYFKLYLAGGIGGNPGVAYPFDENIEPEKILYYIEAMVNLFIAEGDYENKAKARMRFIPRRMGVEAFIACYRDHVAKVIETESLEGISPVQEICAPNENPIKEYPMVIAQKQSGRYTVVIHPLCGQLNLSDARIIYAFIEAKQQAELRSSMNEEIYIRNLTKAEAIECIEAVKSFNGISQIAKTVTCIGTPSCQQGVIESQVLCTAINEAASNAGISGDVLPVIHISGCPSSCSRHQVSAIGFVGRKKKIEDESMDCFELYLGGSVGADARLGESVGILPAKAIPGFIVELSKMKESQDKSFAELTETAAFNQLLKQYTV